MGHVVLDELQHAQSEIRRESPGALGRQGGSESDAQNAVQNEVRPAPRRNRGTEEAVCVHVASKSSLRLTLFLTGRGTRGPVSSGLALIGAGGGVKIPGR